MKVNIYNTLLSCVFILVTTGQLYSQTIPTQEELKVSNEEYSEIIKNANLPLNFPQQQFVNVEMNLPKPIRPHNNTPLLIDIPLIPWIGYKEKQKTHEKDN